MHFGHQSADHGALGTSGCPFHGGSGTAEGTTAPSNSSGPSNGSGPSSTSGPSNGSGPSSTFGLNNTVDGVPPSSAGHPDCGCGSFDKREISRRSLLTLSGVAALGAGIAYTVAPSYSPTARAATPDPDLMGTSYPLRGDHQPGILTPAQQQMQSVGFDVTATSRDEVIALLTEWTEAAEAMMAAKQIGTTTDYPDVPPDDTGETMGLGPGALTITFGFGQSFLWIVTAMIVLVWPSISPRS